MSNIKFIAGLSEPYVHSSVYRFARDGVLSIDKVYINGPCGSDQNIYQHLFANLIKVCILFGWMGGVEQLTEVECTAEYLYS